MVNHNFDTLINGAALNLSNMENFEFTKLAVTADKAEDRPDINSDKQLWSVGGYIGSFSTLCSGVMPIDGHPICAFHHQKNAQGPSLMVPVSCS